MRSSTRPRSRCPQGGKKRKKCGAVFSPAKKVPMHKKQKGSKNTALASSCTCSRRRRWWNKKSKNVALPRPHYEGITGGSCGGWWPLQGKYEKSSARNSGAGFCTPPPARESIRVQTACIATCRALFAGWHLAAVYVAMHIMSRVQRERWFLALRPCSGQGLFFFPCSRASLLHQKTFSYVLLLLLPYNFSIRLHICY